MIPTGPVGIFLCAAQANTVTHRDPILSSNNQAFRTFHTFGRSDLVNMRSKSAVVCAAISTNISSALMLYGRAALRRLRSFDRTSAPLKGSKAISTLARMLGDWHSPSGYSPSFPPFPNVQCGFAQCARNPKLARQIRKGARAFSVKACISFVISSYDIKYSQNDENINHNNKITSDYRGKPCELGQSQRGDYASVVHSEHTETYIASLDQMCQS